MKRVLTLLFILVLSLSLGMSALADVIYEPEDDFFEKHRDEKELMAFVDYQAMAVATEINILDPHYVVIGGGVVNMKGYPKELLAKKIREHTRKPYPEKTLDLIWAGDEEDKSVRGAAVYAAGKVMDRVLSKA